MQPRYSMSQMSVCPSVCPSIKRVNCDKTKKTSAHIFIQFWQEVWLVDRSMIGRDRNFEPSWPRRFRNADFQAISGSSSSAVTPSEKSLTMTNGIHYGLSNKHKMNSVRKMAVFRQKVHLFRRNSATKFLYVKAVSDKVVRHSLAYLSNSSWWTSYSTWKSWPKNTHPPAKSKIIFQ